MSERVLQFSMETFLFPVFLCDKDGHIGDTNAAAKSLVGGFAGKHVARFSPEVGDALNAFRIRGVQDPGSCLQRGSTSYSIHIYQANNAIAVVMLVPQVGTEKLARRVQYLQAAFDSTMEGIWVADADAKVCAINKTSERLNSVRARQVVGKTSHEVLADGYIDRSVTVEVLKRNRQVSFVQHIIQAQRHLHVTGTPHYDGDGNIEFVVITERDVTDLKNMRSSMEETRLARDKAQDLLTEMSLGKNDGDDELVAASQRMRIVADMGLKIGRLESQCILITGEHGAGRHSLARYIHRHGVHSNGHFMNINCAALPPSLQEAELFGHAEGVVPGAAKAQAGVLSLVEKGTLMLDDVDELSQQAQAKLIRCLDDGYYTPIGTRQKRKLECCLIVTSRQDLGTLVANGAFREDLYHRLTMFSLHVPPLRERADDIPGLAHRFLDHANEILRTRLTLTPYSVELLRHCAFPGNTHDLEALIMKAAAISDGGDFSAALRAVMETDETEESACRTLHERIDDVERDALTYAMETCANTREMAKVLGISQSGVVRRLHKHGLSMSR